MEKEIWKPIKGYENLYEISSLGRVKSIDREVSRSNHKYKVKGKILKATRAKNGYLVCNLYRSSKPKTFYVHKLVAVNFLNHVPKGYEIVIDHIDNSPINNMLDNIQVISHRENCTKDKKNGTSKYAGVSWCNTNKKWISCLRHKGKFINLGLFECELEASDAYQNKIKDL